MDAILEAIARACCHGLDARSLSFGGHVLPFCARCTGLFIGVAAAALGLAAAGRLRRHRLLGAPTMLALAAPWIFSGMARLAELGGIDLVGNPGRALLGFGCGAGATVMLAPLWARVLWPRPARERPSPAAAVALMGLAGVVAAASAPAIDATARGYLASAAAASGFILAVVALNALLMAGVILPPRRPMRFAPAPLLVCAAVAEIVALSAIGSWLRAL